MSRGASRLRASPEHETKSNFQLRITGHLATIVCRRILITGEFKLNLSTQLLSLMIMPIDHRTSTSTVDAPMAGPISGFPTQGRKFPDGSI
jgi:hypothetical protein